MKFLKLSSACTCYKNSFLVTLSYFTLTYISHAMFPPFIILHTYFQKLNSRDITAISLYILLFQTQFSRHHGYFLYVLCFPFYHTSMYIRVALHNEGTCKWVNWVPMFLWYELLPTTSEPQKFEKIGVVKVDYFDFPGEIFEKLVWIRC